MDNMALNFECRINKNALLHTVFFGDFAHWSDPEKIPPLVYLQAEG